MSVAWYEGNTHRAWIRGLYDETNGAIVVPGMAATVTAEIQELDGTVVLAETEMTYGGSNGDWYVDIAHDIDVVLGFTYNLIVRAETTGGIHYVSVDKMVVLTRKEGP